MFGIFISGSATIGGNCVMFQHVTIGSNSIPGSRGASAPVIGDHCYIGAGAKIIGNVRVGDHCRIGANAVVVVDVPPNSIVVAQPARIITRDYSLDTRFHSRQGSGWCYFADGAWIQEEDPDTLAHLDAAFPEGSAS